MSLPEENAKAVPSAEGGSSKPGSLPDPTTRTLVVYQTREEEFEKGDIWNAEYGLMWVPNDWEYLPPGDVDEFLERHRESGEKI